MKILIACEYTAVVRTAFEEQGFKNVVSCDLLNSERPGKHFIGDVREKLQEDWNVIIAFPPCQFISSSGLYLCDITKYGSKAYERIKKRNEAIDLFFEIYFSKAYYKCLENPTGFISSSILKPTQIIHPFYFGDDKMKRTCLWLQNLPMLVHSKEDNLFSSKTHHVNPVTWIEKTSTKYRSRLSPYIANEMAVQWGHFLKTQTSSMYLPKESVQSEKFIQD